MNIYWHLLHWPASTSGRAALAPYPEAIPEYFREAMETTSAKVKALPPESGLMAYSRPTKQALSLHVIGRAHSNMGPQGVGQFEHRFECLMPGETLVYFVGDLATARQATEYVDWIADRAIKLSQPGPNGERFAYLTQRRIGKWHYEYRITKAWDEASASTK